MLSIDHLRLGRIWCRILPARSARFPQSRPKNTKLSIHSRKIQRMKMEITIGYWLQPRSRIKSTPWPAVSSRHDARRALLRVVMSIMWPVYKNKDLEENWFEHSTTAHPPMGGWKFWRYSSSSADAAVVRTLTPPIMANWIATLPAGEAPFKISTNETKFTQVFEGDGKKF